ncbi:MAG: TIGR01777 family oxidoreductase [Verrucomicrobia bacterium]|nr:TIGR01777 family oxidoreductase [Verrucomicrobiota bacterium]
MRIALTGASGFVGREIIKLAPQQGHEIVACSRRPENPVPGAHRTVKFGADLTLDGVEAVIHLAGESIMGRWTAGKKKRILDSRVQGTRQVVEAIARSTPKPRKLVSASGVGIYGDRGDEELTEASPAGSAGFLTHVALAWEREAEGARSLGVPVCTVRVAMVLGRDGGALPLMAPVFRLGLGGKLGTGRQWMSWIHVHDVAALFLHAATHDRLSGPVNGAAPDPVRNADFTRTFGAIVHRPAFLGVPAFVLRTILQETCCLVLDSQRVLPVKAPASGFRFRYPDLPSALSAALGK